MDNMSWEMMIIGAGCAGYVASRLTNVRQRLGMMIGLGFLGAFALRALLQHWFGMQFDSMAGQFIVAVIGACGVIVLRHVLWGSQGKETSKATGKATGKVTRKGAF